MKKNVVMFLRTVLLFIPFSLGMYLLFICLWGNLAPRYFKKNLTYQLGQLGHTLTRIRDAKKLHDIDILIIGSSHAYRGLDPRILKDSNTTVFNLGTSAETPNQTVVLMQRYLQQLHPKTVLYEVYPATFESDGIESTLDIISNDKNDLGSIAMVLKEKNIKVYNTLIYCFFRDVTSRDKDRVETMKQGLDTYMGDGFVQRELHYFKHINHATKEWNIRADQMASFEQVVAMVKKMGARLVIVQAPFTKSLYRSYTNNNYFDEKMKAHGEYYNFNELVDLDDSLHFYDANHLNQKGVERFNEKLKQVVFKK